MPTKPKAKKKRGIVVGVRRSHDNWCEYWTLPERQGERMDACYKHMRRAGLPELKPGESVKVRVCIEAV